jgi:vitamin B12 transporter
MHKTIIIIFFLLLFPLWVYCQDTTYDYDFFFEDEKGITVVGTVRTSQQMAIIEKNDIENRGAGDLAGLLQETLGLNITRYGAYGNQTWINLRGFDSKRVAFLINGVQVNSPLDGKFDINQIDLNSVERLEIIYGGSDSKFNVSGAFGGIINIITVKKHNEGLRISASASNTSSMPGKYRSRDGEMQEPRWEDLFDTQNYTFSAAFGSRAADGSRAFSLSANAFANHAENHFVFLDQAKRLRRKDNNEVWDAGASVSAVWELPDFTKLIASSNFFYSDRNFPMSGFSTIAGNQRDLSARQGFMVDKPRAFHDDLSSELSLTWQFHRLNYTSPSNVISIHEQNSLAAVNRWNWYFSDKLMFRSGIDYRFINLESTEIGSRNRHDGGYYLTAEFKPVKSFMIIPSAKVIATNTGSSNAAVIPKLGFLWNAADNLEIKNNYFRNFKFPDFEELYWSGGGGVGNPDLRPEDGWGADLGASWRITRSLRFENVLFTQWIKDSIHWFSGSSGVWRPENVGEAVLFGLESKVFLEVPVSKGPFKKITAFFSYQYILSYLLSYGYTFDSGKRIPYNPEHTIFGSLELSWNSGSLSVNGRYESMRYHDTANLISLKPVFLLNAGVNQNLGNNLVVFAALRNILNTSYESFYDYPMPGITLTLGLRVNLEVK